MSVRMVTPLAANAMGKAPVTSANPPVLISGNISGVTDRTCIHYILIRYSFNLSIISCVTRQMPFSETRKRLASRMGSSPTTSPSGILTP